MGIPRRTADSSLRLIAGLLTSSSTDDLESLAGDLNRFSRTRDSFNSVQNTSNWLNTERRLALKRNFTESQFLVAESLYEDCFTRRVPPLQGCYRFTMGFFQNQKINSKRWA